jgi:Domain of unknown function (DUF4189)
MRRLWIVVALLAFGYTLLPSTPASAGYGAVAWDEATGKYGRSFNQPDRQRAEERALGECGASGCKILTWAGPARCLALATSEDGKQAAAVQRKDRDAARLAALKLCPKTAGECVVRVTDCNK